MAAFSKAWVALTAIAGLAAGCGRMLGDTSPDAGTTPSGLTGRWAMFKWEDPVAVDLRENDGVLEGRGCCSGFQDDVRFNCCGPVNGNVADRRASFGFSFDYNGSGAVYDYSTDVFVSADGRRMAGTFSRTGEPVAWVRLASDEPSLVYWATPVPALAEHSGVYGLVLTDDPAPGADFVGQSVYRMVVSDRFVFGALGSFWSQEMSWHADAQTLAAGPVPETAPGLPVALSIQADGPTVVSVEATMASGVRYHFQASPWQP
jgi:hypothetical protein